ncbi:MAG: zinc finger CCHC domain-containing protein [Candidatus Bipolaricaulota bacterium]
MAQQNAQLAQNAARDAQLACQGRLNQQAGAAAAAPGGAAGGAGAGAQQYGQVEDAYGRQGVYRTIIKPPKYHHDQSRGEEWYVFKMKFTKLIGVNHYPEPDAKIVLWECMHGKAAEAVCDIDPEDADLTLVDMLEKYEAKFMPRAATALAKTLFERAAQGPKESELDYHTRLRTLYKRAYPNNVDEEMLIRRFQLGLCSQGVKDQVLRALPETYDACLEQAQNERSVIIQRNLTNTAAPMKNYGQPMDLGAIQEAINAIEMSTQTCYNCNNKGHFARDCPDEVDTNKVNQLLGRQANPSMRKPAFFARRGSSTRGRATTRGTISRRGGKFGNRQQRRKNLLATIEDQLDDYDNDEEEVIAGVQEEEEGEKEAEAGDGFVDAEEKADF